MKIKKIQEIDQQATSRRLDTLIRLAIEGLMVSTNNKFNIGVAVRTLKSVGLSPTEITKILGKKSVTDIAPHLYKKVK